MHAQLQVWRDWRQGEGWDEPTVSGSVPDLQPLLAAFATLAASPLPCTGAGDRGLPLDDPMVRALLRSGVGRARGLSDDDLRLLSEWMCYAGGRENRLSRYLCLSPRPLRHRYGLRLDADLGLAIGAFLGGRVAAGPDFEVAAGCYPTITAKAAIITFSYENELGMAWDAQYLRFAVEGELECAMRVNLRFIEKFFRGLFGGGASAPVEGNCSGSASSALWYGPHDFRGMVLGLGAGFEAGALAIGSAGLGLEAIVSASGKPELRFDTSGACLQFGLSVGGGVGIGGEIGGQSNVGAPTVSAGRLARQATPAECGDDDVHDYRPGPLRELASTALYFDTGESDAQGTHAAQNLRALREVAEALAAVSDNALGLEAEIRIVGHASPRWRSAQTEDRAIEENLRLAEARAESARDALVALYARLRDAPLQATIVLDALCDDVELPGPLNVHGMGSSEALADTGDRHDDSARYRRVDVRARVETVERVRRTVASRR
jgi:outer membrane protein OmpA-like peptidoglycan-associated protein